MDMLSSFPPVNAVSYPFMGLETYPGGQLSIPGSDSAKTMPSTKRIPQQGEPGLEGGRVGKPRKYGSLRGAEVGKTAY